MGFNNLWKRKNWKRKKQRHKRDLKDSSVQINFIKWATVVRSFARFYNKLYNNSANSVYYNFFVADKNAYERTKIIRKQTNKQSGVARFSLSHVCVCVCLSACWIMWKIFNLLDEFYVCSALAYMYACIFFVARLFTSFKISAAWLGLQTLLSRVLWDTKVKTQICTWIVASAEL